MRDQTKMQVSVENGAGLERRLTVALEPEQVEAEVEKRLRDFARSARMPVRSCTSRSMRPSEVNQASTVVRWSAIR